MENLHKSVALYVRVSTAGQEQDGYSIGEQIDKLTKYCELQDWHIHDVYKDGGFSGSNLKRPAMQRLIQDVELGVVDTVVVYKLDRLSRSLVDTMQLIEKTFQANNVSFVSMSESFDTRTPVGKVMVSILATFAQFERENIRARMQMGKIGRAKSGKPMATQNPPFGYKYIPAISNYEVSPVEAEIVKKIFAEYLAGRTFRKIRDILNNEGHIGKRVPWSFSTVKIVLTNVAYTGKYPFKGKVYQGSYTPIISEEDYAKAQSEIERRQLKHSQLMHGSRPFRAKYMLSGLIYCGYCGAHFKSGKRYMCKDPNHVRIYRCNSHYSETRSATNPLAATCPSPTYDMTDMEAEVIQQIMNLDFDVDATRPRKIDVKIYENELKKIDSKIERLIDLTANSNMPVETITERIEQEQNNKRNLKQKIKNILAGQNEFTKEDASKVLSEIDNLFASSYETQKDVVHKLIERIDVRENSLKIHWRFM